MKCVIICNPQSGKLGNKKVLNDFGTILSEYEYETQIIYTEYKGHATKIVEELSDVDLLLVAGGDGTLQETIFGNLKRKNKILMAHLPFGTVNDVAHMYGLTPYPLINLRMLLDGAQKNIDVCLLNEQPFVYVCCMGAYVDIAYATPRKLKEKYGRLGYAIYAIQQLKQNFKFYNVSYKMDNREYVGQFSFIFVTNSNRVAGMNNIYEDIKLDDNMYEVLMCNIKTKWDIIKAVYYLKRREINNLPGFVYYKTNNLDIQFDKIPESSWCIDGEEYKCNTNKFNITITKEISMLLPKKNIEKLFE